MGEGRAIYGEPIIYNYGLITYMDWAYSAELVGAGKLVSYARADFKPFDWSCCQFSCASSSILDFVRKFPTGVINTL